MRISPRRRQRALKVHELRQRGRSLRNIGKLLNVSHSTVLDDLKLVETHWSEFAEQSADDFLLEQFSLLQARLRTLLRQDLVKEYGRLNPTDFTRLYEAHNHELALLLRESRRLVDQIHDRAELRRLEADQLEQLEDKLGYPLEELTAAAKPAAAKKTQKLPEPTNAHHGLPKSSKPNHPNQPKPRKTLEIPTKPTQKKIPNQPPNTLTPEQIQKEAETYLKSQPAAAG